MFVCSIITWNMSLSHSVAVVALIGLSTCSRSVPWIKPGGLCMRVFPSLSSPCVEPEDRLFCYGTPAFGIFFFHLLPDPLSSAYIAH